MLEYPEVKTVSAQLNKELSGKRISRVRPPTKVHKFCWFSGEPNMYNDVAAGASVVSVCGFGLFPEITLNNGFKLCFNDGVNARLANSDSVPKDYQLLIEFDDDTILVFTVAMYGGIILHDGNYDNGYYIKSKNAVDILSPEFEAYFLDTLSNSSEKLSAKAFMATEQRFPGIGNGVIQDILFTSGIHPKRKMLTLTDDERKQFFKSTVSVIDKMTACGGRDTEKDIFGNPGGYKTLMSKNSLTFGCPHCGGAVTKEAYLGGSVYYCRVCQQMT